MSEELSEVPTTVSEALDYVIEWLNMGDKAMKTVLHARQANGEDISDALFEALDNDGVQQDMAALAKWFREHPDLDAEIFPTFPSQQKEPT